MRLKDKVAFITGGARGIGLACAQAFLAEGAKIVISDVDARAGKEALKTLNVGEDRAHYLDCDVGDKAAVDRAIAATVASFGKLDIAIANAGIVKTADVLELTEADFDAVLRVNLKGAFWVAQAAARQMVAQKTGGAIIAMSSVNAVMAIPNILPYVVSKGGINQMIKAMAIALAPKGIRVNGIGPGSIATEVFAKVATDKAAMTRILSRTPLGRVGEAEEIGRVAAFLASDDASYITGTTIYADGGRLALNYTVPVPE
ncbi:MAG: SDR family oxidoreductase [Alphaproteobacteria bacterium]